MNNMEDYDTNDDIGFEEFMKGCMSEFSHEEEEKLREMYIKGMEAEKLGDYKKACECCGEFMKIIKRRI